MRHRFSQVDVFSDVPMLGNPLAVVHDADGIGDQDMAAIARWTNLSETSFLLTPTDERADYRVRIFTPYGELPFAGHPTLGSARAWSEAGGTPRTAGRLVQQCEAGLVPVSVEGDMLAFTAPPLLRSGPVDAGDLAVVTRALGLSGGQVLASSWIDNGPGWLGLLLPDADAVLALEPDLDALDGHKVGVVGRRSPGEVEVRAFIPGPGGYEDPVTGSLNAGIAQWLVADGTLPPSYVAHQGTRRRRRGRVHVRTEGGDVLVGGHTVLTVVGTVVVP